MILLYLVKIKVRVNKNKVAIDGYSIFNMRMI